MFEQPVFPIEDAKTFASVEQALDAAFNPNTVASFLKRVQSKGFRVRAFEAILKSGLLGNATIAAYGALVDSDRGQVRERYLRLVEQVAPELRAKFLKVYAYY